MNRVFKLAASVPWAIDAAWLAQILAIANREGPGPEAVSAELGRPLDNTHAVEVYGRVAVVPVRGPIMRYASMFTEISGAVSVDTLARDMRAALASEDVDAILFDIDSPGGEVNGVHELAQQIAAARAVKPCAVYAGGTCASAAYWLASAAGDITVDATAIVGSIGVVMALPNPDAQKAEEIEIVSSNAPNKRPDVSTDEGRATVLATIDALASVFSADVARFRGVTPEKVSADFGQGGVLVGAAAVKAGLVDRLGSFEDALAALGARAALATTAATVRRPMLHNAEGTAMSLHAHAAPKATTTPAAEDPPRDQPAEDRPSESAVDAPADDSKNCGDCKAVSAGSAKYCAGCGAAFPEKKPGDGDGDEDENGEEAPPSSEDPKAIVSGIVALTGAKSGRLAVASVLRWKHAATVDLPKARAEALDVIAASLKQAGKLTPALAADLRALAACDHGSFLASAMTLARGEQIAGLAAQTHEPARKPGDALTGGKSLAQMTGPERAQLMATDRALFDQLLAEDRKKSGL